MAKIKVFGGEVEATPEMMEWLKDYDPAQYEALTANEGEKEVKTTKTKKK